VTAPAADLPADFTIALDPATRIVAGGRTIIGGSPLRISRVTGPGATLVARLAAGGSVGTGIGAQKLVRGLIDGGAAHPRPPAGAGPTAADVAVIIPVKDDAPGLARLRSLLPAVAEVIVVDDGSADAAAIAVAAGDATLIRHDVNRGPGAARQTGWRRAEGHDIVVFVDADVVPEPGWLGALLPHFADPRVGAVAPRVRGFDGPTHPGWLADYERNRSALDLGAAEAPVRPRSRVAYVPTATVAVRRAAIADIGGFDEALRVGEDVDLIWRLGHAGWSVRYVPTTQVGHVPRPTLAAFARQRLGYGTSAAALTDRHGDAVAPLMISSWSAAAWALVLLRRPVAGLAVAATSTALLVSKLDAVDDPATEAIRLAGLGNLWAGRSVADALRRPWWPAAVVVGWLIPRSRPALAAVIVVPTWLAWRESDGSIDPVRFGAAQILDDVAYGTGVWLGCFRARSFRALRPAFTGKFPPT
jgi:mycofactocin system glycosyltransferase